MFEKWKFEENKKKEEEKTYRIDSALRRSIIPSSFTTRCGCLRLFLSRSKSIAIALSNGWWHMRSLSEIDFTFCIIKVPPKRECLPGGGLALNLMCSRFRAVTNSCSSRCFSTALRCIDTSANDSAVWMRAHGSTQNKRIQRHNNNE